MIEIMINYDDLKCNYTKLVA